MDPMIVAAITAFGTIGAGYLTYRVSNRKLRSDVGQQMIDQQQEDLAALRIRVAQLERTDRLKDDYISTLRRHIEAGGPPPPPGWPERLIT